jgi:hypothetical protein
MNPTDFGELATSSTTYLTHTYYHTHLYQWPAYQRASKRARAEIAQTAPRSRFIFYWFLDIFLEQAAHRSAIKSAAKKTGPRSRLIPTTLCSILHQTNAARAVARQSYHIKSYKYQCRFLSRLPHYRSIAAGFSL